MDGIETKGSSEDQFGSEGMKSRVLVIGATSKPNNIDAALRRSGRFDYEIAVGQSLNSYHSCQRRLSILQSCCAHLPLHPSLLFGGIADQGTKNTNLQSNQSNLPSSNNIFKVICDNGMEELAYKTFGYVAADLELLCKHAALLALNKSLHNLNDTLQINMDDFNEALTVIRPSQIRRNLNVDIPKVLLLLIILLLILLIHHNN
jgi:transitional endoplasmic reticulum ATPase